MRQVIVSLVIILLAGAAFAGEFRRSNVSETVTDSTNNLMWQDNVAVTSGITYTWADAIAYCENLDLAGFTDWRLPSINELRSIVDYGAYNPTMYSIFKNVAAKSHWTSTTYNNNTSYAIFMDLRFGYTSGSPKTTSFTVRCVR